MQNEISVTLTLFVLRELAGIQGFGHESLSIFVRLRLQIY